MSDNQLLKDLEVQARKEYETLTPAFAYVFQHHAENGLRLEAPDILLEYSNGVPFGRGLFSKPSTLGTTANLIGRSKGASLLSWIIGLRPHFGYEVRGLGQTPTRGRGHEGGAPRHRLLEQR